MKRWLQRAKELHKHEEDLHSKLPAHLRRSLRANAFCCWREMLLELGYKDAKVIDEIIRGFPMTGWTEESGVFVPDVRPPDMTVDQLRGIALG